MPFFQKNIDFLPRKRISAWRSLSISLWRTAKDPSVYGFLDLDAEKALEYIEKLKSETGLRITMSHFVGRAVAVVLTRHSDLNSTLRWGGIYPRKSVDVTFTVASDEHGIDLGAHTVRSAHVKSVVDFATEMGAEVHVVRQFQDPKHRVFKRMIAFFPSLIAARLVDFGSWVLFNLNLWTPLLGLPRDGFGSVLVTNVGSLGLDCALAALIPATRIPLVVVIGAVQERPVVRDGQVVIRRILQVGITVDHRIVDGVHAAQMARTLRRVFADPARELRTN